MQTLIQQQDANGLLDMLLAKHQLKNDAALARMLCLQPPVLSKLRHHTMPAGDSLVLRCTDLAGLTLAEVRQFVPSPYVSVA